MSAIISFVNSLAPVILVLLAIGVMFKVVQIKSILFVLLFVFLLPFLISAIVQAFKSCFSSTDSWKAWLVMILIGLIATRIFIDRVFRNRR